LGKFLAATFEDHVGSRTYKVHVPISQRRGPMPLIVMLHGCTQNADDFAAGTRMNTLSDKHACVIVYPEQSAAANPAKCWNWFNAGDQKRSRGEPAIIAGITRQIMQAYPIDERRVFVAGLSAGASMAIIMAATYPELYTAIGAHSGLAYRSASNMLGAFAAMRNGAPAIENLGAVGIPIIAFQGERDPTINPRNSQQIISQWLASQPQQSQAQIGVPQTGATNGYGYSRTEYRDARGALFAEHWLVDQLGHAWCGGSAQGTYADPAGPDASAEMLRFFLRLASRPRIGILSRLMRPFRAH
jgi:poly(hydroxyalkanoate) depolymerase family esterase